MEMEVTIKLFHKKLRSSVSVDEFFSGLGVVFPNLIIFKLLVMLQRVSLF